MCRKKQKLDSDFFNTLQKELTDLSLVIIEKIAKSEFNNDIYMFAYDINEDYGSILIACNSNSLISKSIKEKYPNEAEYNLRGVRGVKYNTGECEELFFYVGEYSKKLQKILSTYDELLNEIDYKVNEALINQIKSQFVDAVVNSLNNIQPKLAKLSTTQNFISYVMKHNADEQEIIELMQRTISTEKMDMVFPEIKEFQNHRQQLQELSEASQLSYWVNSYLDTISENETENMLFLKEAMLRWSHDIHDIIKSIFNHSDHQLIKEIQHKFENLENNLGLDVFHSGSETMKIIQNRNVSDLTNENEICETLNSLNNRISKLKSS